jgi:choline dehydrogenase-like flavoprotein
MAVEADGTFRAVAVWDVVPEANLARTGTPGATIRKMGTAHMGTDPRTSVLNQYNQAHDVPNLFITDGSAMASTATQNPSLTYMALSARAAYYAAEFLKAGKL